MIRTESDKKLFIKLYKENKQKFYYIAYKVLQNETDAESAVYAGLLKMVECFSSYVDEPYEKLVKLCCMVIQFQACKIQKAGLGNAGDPETEAIPDMPEQSLNQYEPELIVEAFRQLGEEELILLKMQYELELSPKNIGELLDMPAQSVTKRVQCCINRLVQVLERGR